MGRIHKKGREPSKMVIYAAVFDGYDLLDGLTLRYYIRRLQRQDSAVAPVCEKYLRQK